MNNPFKLKRLSLNNFSLHVSQSQAETPQSFWSTFLPDSLLPSGSSAPSITKSKKVTAPSSIPIKEMPGIFCILDSSLHLLQWNDQIQQLTNLSADELEGKNVLDFVEDQQKPGIQDALKKLREQGSGSGRLTVTIRQGVSLNLYVNIRRVLRGDRKLLLLQGMEMTSYKRHLEQVELQRDQYATMLREIHHRVKNNLAIIAGLLQLQSFNTDDARVIEILQDSQTRIQSMAMVHEKLYKSSTLSTLPIASYIGDLLDSIMATLSNQSKRIDIDLNADDVTLQIEQAIPLGLMINELVVNALKYAFKNQHDGIICVRIRQRDQIIFVKVRDNGAGLPDHFSIDGQDSLGLTLIKTLTQQLEANIHFYNADGAVFEISFKKLNAGRKP